MLAGNQRHRIAESGILKIRLLNIISDHFSATPYYIDQIPHSNYSITETAGFPREENRTTGRLGQKGDCVIPVNLEENVKWLHQFLFNDYEYTPSAMVKECSKKIEADTGKTLN